MSRQHRRKPGRPAPSSAIESTIDPELESDLDSELETLVSTALGHEPPVLPSPDLRARLMKGLDPAHPLAGFAARLGRLLRLPEASAMGVLDRAAGAGAPPWTAWCGGAIHTLDVAHGYAAPETRARLVVTRAGARMPWHEHAMDEWVLVLRGGYRDTGGEDWLPGDLHCAAAGTAHGQLVHPDQDCLVAALETPAGLFTRPPWEP